MADSEVSARMREDWNARAREDAGYYVAFGRRDSDDAAFFATATEVINGLEWELSRVPIDQRGNWRALEIGCGPGRLLRPMSRHFVEIHGVDVSDEMIALAKEKLRDVPNAHPHATDGASLRQFENEYFDFVYSYAVFQHIPSRDVVFEYLRETHRVLKNGGLARLQFNGLPRLNEQFDTWSGARISSGEVLEFAREHDFQVLALEGVATQYMWTTWRKQPRGWFASLEDRQIQAEVKIRRITNANSSEPVAPSRGRFASISIWVENLPADAGLHHLQVTVGSSFGTVCYIGPPDKAGLQQINVILPELEATGLLPVAILWLGQRISPPATLRVIPPGPSVPRVRMITDGVNLVADHRIETRHIKMVLEEIQRPDEVDVFVDGLRVMDLEYFCTDPRPQRFEMNCVLPEEITPGTRYLQLHIGRRKLPPIAIEVTA
ncbi:MAG: methyltransferase domain-containing protein [Acidobacteriia bacterium]|nr:methyltransferase domain-containing protein [Terriglobia bacterium]